MLFDHKSPVNIGEQNFGGDRHMDKHMDILTYRLTWPRGQFIEKVYSLFCPNLFYYRLREFSRYQAGRLGNLCDSVECKKITVTHSLTSDQFKLF